MTSEGPGRATAARSPEQTSVEQSSRRTGMSFQRTRLSAERTLMSVIRTALSLIGFGFTIAQFFEKAKESGLLKGGSHSARNFGAAMMLLGVALLVLGIIYHVLFMLELRRRRNAMIAEGLIHGQSGFPASMTLITAILLLLVGITAVVSILYRQGPFG